MALQIHTQGAFNNHASCSLYRMMVTAPRVMSMMKMGSIVPRAGIKSTSLAFQASVLPLLHHIGSLMTPLCSRLPVYAAPYLTGQCRLL